MKLGTYIAAPEPISTACRDIRTKFHKDCFRHSQVNKGDTQTHRQQGDLISLLLFFENKEIRLKRNVNTNFACLGQCVTCELKVNV
jgi:hypothetical protein